MIDRESRAHLLVACVLGGATLLGAPETADAQARIYDTTVSNCTDINCSSMLVQGSLLTYGGTYQAPWTALVWVGSGQCVRVENVSRTSAVRIFGFPNRAEQVIAHAAIADPTNPWGYASWAIRLRPYRGAGWHPIVINGATLGGPTPVEASFTLAVGAYPEGNANCTEGAPVGLAEDRR